MIIQNNANKCILSRNGKNIERDINDLIGQKNEDDNEKSFIQQVFQIQNTRATLQICNQPCLGENSKFVEKTNDSTQAHIQVFRIKLSEIAKLMLFTQ